MKIRVMNLSDYEQVYQLWLSCSGMGLNNLDDSKEGIERFLKRNPETCFVAVIEQTIIGVIIAGNDGRRGYIYHTAVNPNYRHQGIATELVNEAIKALKTSGINKISLVVFSKNIDGNAFWEKNGFTLILTEDIPQPHKGKLQYHWRLTKDKYFASVSANEVHCKTE